VEDLVRRGDCIQARNLTRAQAPGGVTSFRMGDHLGFSDKSLPHIHTRVPNPTVRRPYKQLTAMVTGPLRSIKK